ncbi:hypothetical protein F2981_16935 [Sinorhizobium meliloti]|nr:hypothetical protein [Sinorhizobium meliloti]
MMAGKPCSRFLHLDRRQLSACQSPLARSATSALCVGQTYTLDELHVRWGDARPLLATLHDIWQSLPEHLSGAFRRRSTFGSSP